jgi:hypothetical protein
MLAYMMLLQVKRLLMRWSVTAELSCDRAAMLVAQDVNIVVSTLLKVSLVKQSQPLQCAMYNVCTTELSATVKQLALCALRLQDGMLIEGAL